MLIISVVYFLIPKYQLINHSGSIYKLNRLTGKITQEIYPSKAPKGFGDTYSTKKPEILKKVLKKPSILLKPKGYGD